MVGGKENKTLFFIVMVPLLKNLFFKFCAYSFMAWGILGAAFLLEIFGLDQQWSSEIQHSMSGDGVSQPLHISLQYQGLSNVSQALIGSLL